MKRDDVEALRAALRRGDPAADLFAPTPADVARMRERVLQTHRSGRAPGPGEGDPWHRSPRRALAVAAVAALLVLALGAELWLRRAAVDAGRRATAPSARVARAADEPAARGRQVHFTTPGGTRIVWVLFPASQATETDRDRGRRGPGDP